MVCTSANIIYHRYVFCSVINIYIYEHLDFLPASTRKSGLTAIINNIGNSAMLSILGSHLFLNLKEEAELGTNVGIGTVNRYDHTLSIPQFAGVAIETSHSTFGPFLYYSLFLTRSGLGEILGSSDLGNTILN